MKCQVMFRLPGERQYVRVGGIETAPEKLSDISQLDGKRGFVFAPFVASQATPILLYNVDGAETCDLPEPKQPEFCLRKTILSDEERSLYAADFRRFHRLLTAGDFQKLVLSRSSEWAVDGNVVADELFFRACRAYPAAFISLVNTPNHGIWLMSTPEVLLQMSAGDGYTMALAGTILATDKPVWSDKNKEEQALVADYIRRQLDPFAVEVCVGKPQTVRAANVMHLRTDIRFSLKSNSSIVRLLDALHPTPAVCGLPKDEARKFIIANENSPRLYYSGFCGLLDVEYRSNLFVSLRCMQLAGSTIRLYAGGGLIEASNEDEEWQETCQKMEAMRMIIDR